MHGRGGDLETAPQRFIRPLNSHRKLFTKEQTQTDQPTNEDSDVEMENTEDQPVIQTDETQPSTEEEEDPELGLELSLIHI